MQLPSIRAAHSKLRAVPRTHSQNAQLDSGRPQHASLGRMHDDLDGHEESGLTTEENVRRRRTATPDAISVIRSMASQDRDRVALATLTKTIGINILLLLFWYGNSIGISVFNTWVISKDELDFHFPLFFTSFHMVIQFIFASMALYALPQFRPGHRSNKHYTRLAQTRDETQETTGKGGMTRLYYLTRIIPCGAATGLDIGLGNTSLKFISLTFYTMCKSSVLGFVLLFALLFRLESPSWRIALVLAFMTFGVIMMVAGETAFDPTGFALIMTSAAFSGFRWSLTQIMLLRNSATGNPFSSIFFLTPIMFFVLVTIAFPVEGLSEFMQGFAKLVALKGAWIAAGVLLFPGLMAFSMTASEFGLLKRTSVVTLSVCGIFKEVLMIVTASTVFGDPLTRINLSGLAITISSIAAYNYMKFTKMRAAARRDADLLAENNDLFDRERDHARRPSTPGLLGPSLGAFPNKLGGDVRIGPGTAPAKRPEDHE